MLRGHESVVLPGVVASKSFAGTERRNHPILYAFLGALVAVLPAACQSRGPDGAGSKPAETRGSALTSTVASASQILAAAQAQPGSPVQPACRPGIRERRRGR